jgi:hypothetical protein
LNGWPPILLPQVACLKSFTSVSTYRQFWLKLMYFCPFHPRPLWRLIPVSRALVRRTWPSSKSRIVTPLRGRIRYKPIILAPYHSGIFRRMSHISWPSPYPLSSTLPAVLGDRHTQVMSETPCQIQLVRFCLVGSHYPENCTAPPHRWLLCTPRLTCE